MLAQVIETVYDFGSHVAVLDPGRSFNKPSFLNVKVCIGRNRTEYARIDRFFKERLGRLSPERRERIAAAAPATVELEIARTIRKNKHIYAVSLPDLERWLERVQED